jgi:hypothetical protein
MGIINASLFVFVSFSCLGKKRFLKEINLLEENTWEKLLQLQVSVAELPYLV